MDNTKSAQQRTQHPNATRMGTMAFSTLIRARKSLGLSQAAVAKRIGVGREHFNRVENAVDGMSLTHDQFMLWAAAVGCTVKVTRNDVECGG